MLPLISIISDYLKLLNSNSFSFIEFSEFFLFLWPELYLSLSLGGEFTFIPLFRLDG